jgi:hypothetical protein
MYKNLLIFSLIPCLCFSQVSADASVDANEDSKLFSEFLKEKTEGVPLLGDLSISGKLQFGFVAANQYLSKIKENDIPSAFMDGDVNINYKTVVDGIGWGFKIGTKARSGLIKSGSAIVDTSFLFADSDKLGQFRLGYSKSAGAIFSISYADAMTGYNIVDSGNLATFFAQTSGTIIGTGFDKDDGKSLKLVWLSPTIKGWSLGLSYAPNSRDGHLFKEKRNKVEKDFSKTQNFADESGYTKDSFSAGISYEYGNPEAFNLKLSVAGWLAQGRSDNSDPKNVKGYNLGAIFGYGKYKLALSFTDNKDSMLPKVLTNDKTWTDSKGVSHVVGMGPGANNGKVYTAGLGYFGEKWEMSAGYFHAVKKWSDNDRAQTNIATVAVQYNVDKVWSAFIEYDNVRTKTSDRIYYSELCDENPDGVGYRNNRANLIVAGIKVNI